METAAYKNIDWHKHYANYTNGKSRLLIAKEIGCSQSTVYRNFYDRSLIVRTHEEFGLDNRKGNAIQIDKFGRVFVRENGKRIRRAHSVWIKVNGPIPKGYVIHHIDFVIDNDSIENLQLMTKSEHAALHNKMRSGKNRD